MSDWWFLSVLELFTVQHVSDFLSLEETKPSDLVRIVCKKYVYPWTKMGKSLLSVDYESPKTVKNRLIIVHYVTDF